ncbi:MAG: ZIP family metal transporter [Jatrophihabitans sp.]|uniref:ZIP family metal transporter n=1 Tax=Jatrophihabitans sp. TaxID=1932789 RepID=UPI003F7EF21A
MAVLVSLLAFVSTMTGGVVAMRARDKLHLILGLAAGVLLGVAAFDLLPEALDTSKHVVFGVPAAMLMVIAGFFTIHIVERSLAIHRGHEQEFGGHHHGREHAAVANKDLPEVGLLAGSGLVLHSTLDGVGIGVAFQANNAIGIAVAIAVIAHDFADGFNTFTITSLYGNARKRAMTLLGLDALAPVVGAAIGMAVPVPEGAIGLYLGYFAGLLLYLATSDILPEAHARHPSRLTLVCTVAGAAFMWLVVGLSQ